MPVTYETETKFAKDLVRDDVFDIGGLLYQTLAATPNAHEYIVLNLSLIATQKPYEKAPAQDATLILPPNVMIDVVKD